MVCLGNICRSPLAEGILKSKIQQQKLDWTVSSAGTGAYHAGDLPDPRSIATALDHGIDIRDQRAQQIQRKDLEDYDLILTMDRSNYQNVLKLSNEAQLQKKVVPILDFAYPEEQREVPDPYWDDNGFTKVYKILDHATDALLHQLLK